MSEYTSSTGAFVAVVPTATGPVEINKTAGTLVPTSGPNRILPPLSPLKARSTVAAILSVLALIGPLLGGGLGELLTEIAASADLIQQETERAVNAFNALLGVASLIWLWWERRAPNYRLSLSRP